MESIYGAYLPALQAFMDEMLGRIEDIRKDMKETTGMDPVEHCLSRLKSEDSMREKLKRMELEETTENAVFALHDAVGIRVVCAFLDDVYTITERLKSFEDLKVEEEKDYIKNAKPNGYRSLHIILRNSDNLAAEVQLRTISQDTWAALEHHMKYKKGIKANEQLVVAELKRCADELASTDISMQTIKKMIVGDL